MGWNLSLHIYDIFGNLHQEARGKFAALVGCAVALALGQNQFTLGARSRHIHQSAFLFLGSLQTLTNGAMAGENALVQPHHKHIGELQSLRLVNGHQLHGIFVVAIVGIGVERDVLQIIIERHRFFAQASAVFIVLDAVEQFGDIFKSVFVLIAAIFLFQTAAREHLVERAANATTLRYQGAASLYLLHEISHLRAAEFGRIDEGTERFIQRHRLL